MRPRNTLRVAAAVRRLRTGVPADEVLEDISAVHPDVEWHPSERFFSDISAGKRASFHALDTPDQVIQFAFGLLRATFRPRAAPASLETRLSDVNVVLEEFLGTRVSSLISRTLRQGFVDLHEDAAREDFLVAIEAALIEWLEHP